MSGFPVVLATHNAHKVTEFQEMLAREVPGLTVLPYDGPEPVEDGTSFEENALLKARAAAIHTGRIALADDSGIAVDLLGGSPGIFSARWAGSRKSDEANRHLLLEQLSDIADEHRAAHFVCTIAVVVPDGHGGVASERIAVGRWDGRVARAESGDNGFGYDSVFLPDGVEGSAAELTPDRKAALSHRARALGALVPILAELRGA
ncbi:RdgB/HAM1 family non-canonical purine NTP pyrophosphatase [Mycetocola reblochoni]|uniref:dITP/XTP pyrophosphatase n=2 Tax=Mycetocola reblochoni TaxID=331618 RepID=A0A1R4J9C9_9MICO|nr:RdgB/HAM1 family non-canonical purine NTP pyrophosphatase [Mycetocola reblochoni]RLP70085.1 RdgB/HAM1 family non-canonical purine NTP pyrophosphatase [Mycetocola reblochoni]SJN28686.1 Nucleoside 5-triphosphatase RdgB (dHAPTP, dITP, XTP-specific) [Mycetocola reblochoni REB411]